MSHEPGALAGFYEKSLTALGALCERTWHDRLQVVAEGRAARLWNRDGALHEAELFFSPADATGPRDALREVFPGCPLTFQVAELLRPFPLPIERVVLAPEAGARPPAAEVAGKLWRSQFPGTTQWRPLTSFTPSHHVSLLVLVRCEVQAIDQHWSLHRLVLSLPDGARDETLAAGLDLAALTAEASGPIEWPSTAPAHWNQRVNAALAEELETELAAIRARQENYLRRELERVDDYFENYARELTARGARSGSGTAKQKTAERLAAAQAEHARRRQDQVQRHEIRVIPHCDALLLLAEPAWQATVAVLEQGEMRPRLAHFVPRARRWHRLEAEGARNRR